MTSDDDLKRAAQEQATGGPQPGEIWVHYKGGLYTIVSRSLKEDTLEPLVTYHSNARGTNWTRTLANFTERVQTAGWSDVTTPRFARVEG